MLIQTTVRAKILIILIPMLSENPTKFQISLFFKTFCRFNFEICFSWHPLLNIDVHLKCIIAKYPFLREKCIRLFATHLLGRGVVTRDGLTVRTFFFLVLFWSQSEWKFKIRIMNVAGAELTFKVFWNLQFIFSSRIFKMVVVAQIIFLIRTNPGWPPHV